MATINTSAATAEKPQLIDTTPISPTRGPPERRNSLEKHLQHRPDVQDLKNRHILLDTTAAP
jgi:RPEL repeat